MIITYNDRFVDRREIAKGVAAARVLRTVPDPALVDDQARLNEYGGFGVVAMGWTADGERALAVIDTGLIDLPPVLVSLTPDGRDDRWEGLLPSRSNVLSDGFILELPEPNQTPGNAPGNH